MKRLFALTLLASVFILTANAETVNLKRYQKIEPYPNYNAVQWGDKSYVYMDTADTYLSSIQPDANFGAATTLKLLPGQDNSILIQFGQLNRAIWRGSKITNVQLILHPVEGRYTRDTNIVISRVSKEWRDGGADGAPMYWTATYNAAMSSTKPNAILWEKPGGDGFSDHYMKSSLVQNTSAGYDPATNTWILSGAGLLDDVKYWYGKQYKNFGWIIRMQNSKKAKGPVEVYSSETMIAELRPELVITYEPLLTEGDHKGVDLNVTFIERTPRYLRWNDNGDTTYERKMYRRDNAGIMKYPDNGDTKKQPDKGEMMTYTGHIKNTGFDTYKGPLDYVWTYNGKTIKSGTLNVNLPAEKSVTVKIQRPWTGEMNDHRDEKLVLEIDPNNKIKEITKNNNAQSKYIKARSWKYWVEQKPYDYANQFLNAYGSYSYEDYLKWHEQVWNETFLDKSRFDGLAPDGSVARISLDDFELVPDGKLGGGIHRYEDKPDFHFDGEWGTEWVKGENANKQSEIDNIQNFLRAQRIYCETSLLHEGSHQVLGAFDIYWSNIEPSEPNKANGKAKLKDDGQYYITRGSMYAYDCLMGGDDTRPNEHYTEGTDLFAIHTVMGYNANAPYRGGFFGEWQYDLPREISVRLLGADGTPLPDAKVKVWQFSGMEILDEDVVADNLKANASGIMPLPNQDSLEPADYTTITGHTMLKQNPFGRIDVVGSNTVLLLRIEAFGQRDYRFVRLVELNRGYWMGYKDKYTYDVKTQITPAVVDWTNNIAKGKAVQTPLNPQEAGKLTDEDFNTSWNGGVSPSGTFVQFDLGNSTDIGAVRLYQNGGIGQFFQRFKVEVSNDSRFKLGVTEIARQFPFSFGLMMTNDKDVDPQNNNLRWLTYGVKPTSGRYLRITCMENTDHSQLAEVKIYPVKK